MSLKEIKTDREKLLELRKEASTLRWEIDKAVSGSKFGGTLRDHDYSDTWDITHPKSGKPFKANSNWFDNFGTDEDKKRMRERRREVELAIFPDKRQRVKELDAEIKKIYEKYRYLWEDLESWPSEGRACDGESNLADLLWAVQCVLEMDSNMLRCFLDGNALCIVDDDFVDQQESHVMFIDLTPQQIIFFNAMSQKGK